MSVTETGMVNSPVSPVQPLKAPTTEGAVFDVSDGVGDVQHPSQSAAILECIVIDACDGVWYNGVLTAIYQHIVLCFNEGITIVA